MVQTPDAPLLGLDQPRSQLSPRTAALQAARAVEGIRQAGLVFQIAGDMSDPQLPNSSADLVLACLSIHNIHDRDARRAVIDHAARMLRPGGSWPSWTSPRPPKYAADARTAGLVDVARTRPTALMWPPVRVVTARRPAG